MSEIFRAALVIIGDEILSGRTEDANLSYLARWLNTKGVRLVEARVVGDDEDEIADAINHLRARCHYVFTTGGIGPTHDDITAQSVAKAFEKPVEFHPEALKLLEGYYGDQLTPERKQMARVPQGGELIHNKISLAPGFQIENVFVMAGIPSVMRAMLETLDDRIEGGDPVISHMISAPIVESRIAKPLGQIQSNHPSVMIGSYPYYREGRAGAELVIRSTSTDAIDDAVAAIKAALGQLETPIEAENRLDPRG